MLSHFFSWMTSKVPPLRGILESKAPGKNSTHSLKHSITLKALVIHRALDHLDHVVDLCRRGSCATKVAPLAISFFIALTG